MERRQLLKNDSRFGVYEVATLMSRYRGAKREVYSAVDGEETAEMYASEFQNILSPKSPDRMSNPYDRTPQYDRFRFQSR